MTVTILHAEEVALTTTAETSEWTLLEWVDNGGTNSTTMLTFKYGGIDVKVPRTKNWVENPMMHRPQLLLLSCPPVSSPSRVHLELLAVAVQARNDVMTVRTEPADEFASKYVPPTWLALTNAPPVMAMKARGFRRVEKTEELEKEAPGFREEIYILEHERLAFRMRVLLSPSLAPADEAAIRETISKITAGPPSPKK